MATVTEDLCQAAQRVQEQVRAMSDADLITYFKLMQASEFWRKQSASVLMCMDILLDERIRRRKLEWEAIDARKR